MANVRAARCRRDISHANWQKIADEDIRQSSTARIIDNSVKVTLVPGEPVVGSGGFGD